MLLIVLEALAALGMLLFLIWWTMFSGRQRGEVAWQPPPDGSAPAQPSQDDPKSGPPQP